MDDDGFLRDAAADEALHPAWQDYIGSDPNILVGKPVIKGTRLNVEFILGLFASGWTEEQVLASYPHLSHDAIRAAFAFAAEPAKGNDARQLTVTHAT